MAGRSTALPDPPHQVRIIGGRYRGRTLPVEGQEDLRPTLDRVRERVFSWLGDLEGLSCLDLFAGTGALSLEAVSRGAQRAVLVEQNPLTARSLRETAGKFPEAQIEVVNADALSYLGTVSEKFDLVFCDPPYRSGLIEPALKALLQAKALAPGARIYVETGAGRHPAVPGYSSLREGSAGLVRYALWQLSPLL
ncbi:MAG: 16S rRNA (guanine(966)-N(2))-methyltransferase RsmD [Succinivibrionaceae bacterium]|nr:16S rRNA (guanine(966)-N(2))-methyltransferase RsmD [Succinivibrionaceae bacterium]